MERKTVTLCILTLNNEETIGLAIKSVLALVDEVIIVDLGSKDNVRIVAEGYGARVINFDFNDDYAEAKNIALDEAVCDWILWLDPNEHANPIKPVEFQRLLHTNIAGYNVTVTPGNVLEPAPPTRELRLFRHHPKARYKYPVQEQIVDSVRKLQLSEGRDDIEYTNIISIFHDSKENGIGDDPRAIIRILKKRIVTNPCDPQLEYALACKHIVQIEGEIIANNSLNFTIETLEKSLQKSFLLSDDERQEANYLADMRCKLAACYLAAGRIKSSYQIIMSARKSYPEDRPIMLQCVASGTSFLCNIVKNNKSTEAQSYHGRLLALIGLLQELSDINPAYLARYRGDLALLMGEYEKARHLFEAALAISNGYSYALLGLAQCELASNNAPRAISLYMAAAHNNEHNCLAWLRGSQLLEKMGFKDNADFFRSKISKEFPDFLKSEASN